MPSWCTRHPPGSRASLAYPAGVGRERRRSSRIRRRRPAKPAAASTAAITQLQALLARAGSISELLAVQQQISSQESALEALQAQQRALSRETSYATVSITLLSPPQRPVKKARTRRHARGFAAGFAAGWRGLRVVVSGLLTGLGAVLPFAVVVAALAAVGFAGRRRLGRLLRRRSRPTPAG